jgi:hypothetical protein
MVSEGSLAPFISMYVDLLSPAPLWLLSKMDPACIKSCKNTAKILGLLFCRDFLQSCHKCKLLTYNLAEHLVFDCPDYESLRKKLWNAIYSLIGVKAFLSFTKLDRKSQISNLSYGMFKFTSEDSIRENCLRMVCRFMAKLL